MGTRSKRKREEAEIWEDVERGVKQRHDQIIASAKRLEEHFPDANLLALAATDVFVEKAQHTLSARARYMVKYGKWCSYAAVIIMFAGIIYLCLSDYYVTPAKDSFDKFTFTIKLVRVSTISGFILAIVFFLMWLSKSLLHEAMVLYNRRHSLRFGRLFIYTQHGNVKLNQMAEAFQWNAEYLSAFRDMKPEGFFKTILHKLLEMPPDAMKALGGIFRTGKGNKKEKEE